MNLLKHATLASLALGLAASPLFAQNERITVPLSDPAAPAKLEVYLPSGGVVIEAYDGKEILVETKVVLQEVKRKDEEKPRQDGLRRIDNTGYSLNVEEKKNRVKISSPSDEQTVNLSIRVPRRTSLDISCGENGDVLVRGVSGEMELSSAEGSVKAIDVAGTVVAQAMDGSIEVKLASVAPDKPLSFSTFDGDIDVTLPADVQADLRIRAMEGKVLTDFDLKVESTVNEVHEGGEGKGFRWAVEKEVRAQLGGGGQEIVFKTYEGDVVIRKAK